MYEVFMTEAFSFLVMGSFCIKIGVKVPQDGNRFHQKMEQLDNFKCK